uniref:Uncharacterized protein n=1 Tax=Inoviridae sp. ctDEu7 TaxID=2826759 RepID=A0A8S5MV92_9VIRU|nr:MAG TPA: hypothetical protein [Inoviridae sp. ctDEu7]
MSTHLLLADFLAKTPLRLWAAHTPSRLFFIRS